MATLVLDQARALNPAGDGAHNRVAASVFSALSAIEPARRTSERRRDPRHPYPYPIHLTPYGENGRPQIDRTFVVIGKHLSIHGLDFYCRHPLAAKRVIASLECGNDGWIGLVLELSWCRFSRHGWYDNGGRFVAQVRSPLLELEDHSRVA